VRRLLSGPHGCALRDRLLAKAQGQPGKLWIVGSRLARDQVFAGLGKRGELPSGTTVWTWRELWEAVRRVHAEGPAPLSAAGVRAVFNEALDRARNAGALNAVDSAVDWPGFRRRLAAQIARWTRAERSLSHPPRESERDATVHAQWAVYVQYRGILRELNAEDVEGFSVWASDALLREAPTPFSSAPELIFLDANLTTAAHQRTVEAAQAQGNTVTVCLNYQSDPMLAEVYSPAGITRNRLLEGGFREVLVDFEDWRPTGLRDVEQEIFRADAHLRPRLHDASGLRILGAPEGEGIGLILARELQGLLDQGVNSDEVLVLVRRWDDVAERILEVVKSWGIRIHSPHTSPLSSCPAIAALRKAMAIPGHHWETSGLIQWLRHGQVAPPWAERIGSRALANTASVVQSTRVFRGLRPLLDALDRVLSNDKVAKPQKDRTEVARKVITELARWLDPLDQPRYWYHHCEALRDLAKGVGIGTGCPEILDALWDALDEHGAILDGLGHGERPWSWSDFQREVSSIANEIDAPPSPTPIDSIPMLEVDSARGARASWVFLVNLGEGTFPTPDSIDLTQALVSESDDDDSGASANAPSTAYANEMERFLEILGAADQGLAFLYPTSDVQGQELLKAGFLDDLIGRLTPETRADPKVHEVHSRFDPTLIDRPELARSPADARVRAVALACVQRETGPLRSLARGPADRRSLEGTATALRTAESRLQSKWFGPFDGVIQSPSVLNRIQKNFDASYTFSPSQLESYLFCPFQFFMRYVLKIEPIDDRDELEENYTERGSRIHRILEELEQLILADQGTRAELFDAVIQKELESEREITSDIDRGLNRIEQLRMTRMLRRYARQHTEYESNSKLGAPRPHLFEATFGFESLENSFPALHLGEGDEQVKLQGKIDRIDLVADAGASTFRVIDYKSGSPPLKSDVKKGVYLQLPLYALAVERLILAEEGRSLHDVGYWGLAGDGFKSIFLKEWEGDRDALETHVIRVVAELRRGQYMVDSCKDDCVQRCEYGSVCRMGQTRSAHKSREVYPILELKI